MIILWLFIFLFSIVFCYYTSDKSYYITWWDKYIDSCTDGQIERNKKKFLKEQGREGMTRKQRIKGTMLLVIIYSVFYSSYMALFIYMSFLMYMSIFNIVSLPLEK